MKTLLIVTLALALAGQTAAQPAPAPQPTNCEKLAGVWTRDKVQDDVEYTTDLTLRFSGENVALTLGDNFNDGKPLSFTVRDCDADVLVAVVDAGGYDSSTNLRVVPVNENKILAQFGDRGLFDTLHRTDSTQ